MFSPDRIKKGLYWDKAWTLVSGCTPCSPGCTHCWALAMEKRFSRQPKETICDQKTEMFVGKKVFGNIQIHTERLTIPLERKKPMVWAIWNDLFHESVPNEFITTTYEVMQEAKQHIFIVCTKRPDRIVSVLYDSNYLGGGDYLPNVWHMTTAENQKMADKRIPELLKMREASTGWPVLGLSIEPMLGPVNITRFVSRQIHSIFCRDALPSPVTGIVMGDRPCKCRWVDWVILGGESGPGARPMSPDWARSVRDQCQEAGVQFFFKQWGEWIAAYKNERKDEEGNPIMFRIGKKKAGRLLDGREWSEFPCQNQL